MKSRNKPTATEANKMASAQRLLFEVDRSTGEKILDVREREGDLLIITNESVHIVTY